MVTRVEREMAFLLRRDLFFSSKSGATAMLFSLAQSTRPIRE